MNETRTQIPQTAWNDDPFFGIPNADGSDDYKPYFIGGASIRDDRIASQNDD